MKHTSEGSAETGASSTWTGPSASGTMSIERIDDHHPYGAFRWRCEGCMVEGVSGTSVRAAQDLTRHINEWH